MVYIFNRGVISAASPKSYVYTPLVGRDCFGLAGNEIRVEFTFELVRHERVAKPCIVGPTSYAARDNIRLKVQQFQLFLCLQADYRLVESHTVQNRPYLVLCVVMCHS